MLPLDYRLFYDPEPPERELLDAVSSLNAAIQQSLSSGVLRRRSFFLQFPCYIFNFLFKDKGSKVKNKPGKLYERCDFSSMFFSSTYFENYNKHGECCVVSFPIYMYSTVKFQSRGYDKDGQALKRSFSEIISLKIVKRIIK